MPSRGKTPPSPSKTSHLFGSRKSDERAPATHERIAADIEAFRKRGGKIEVLGVTRSLLRVGAQPGDAPPAAVAPKPTPNKPRNR
jgi:hypothetical protein